MESTGGVSPRPGSVVESVDTSDLKSVDHYGRASSSLATPTSITFVFIMSLPKCNKAGNEPIGSGKPQGTIFGGITIRQIKRKRQRQLEKKQAKERVSPHSDQAARGFA